MTAIGRFDPIAAPSHFDRVESSRQAQDDDVARLDLEGHATDVAFWLSQHAG
jgi:hypothetical protein